VPDKIDQTYIIPTPERARRGVELLDKAIADDEGRPSQPYRSIDILGALHRRGAITAEMREAGEEFQNQFRLAQIDSLTAADLMRAGCSGRVADPEIFSRARESVWKSLLSVGGIASPGGSCLWHVLGWEKSLKEWAQVQGWGAPGRRVSAEAASGILIATLGTLSKKSA
jgi:hypothetical protein